jgi:solute carrier family 25 phosphate transporter 23/24/25/41
LDNKGVIPYVGIKLSSFESMKRFHKELFNGRPITDIENLIYGGVAGCLAVTLTFPTDVLRRVVQVEVTMNNSKTPSYLDMIRRIYRQDGMGGFFKGLKVTYYKVIPSTALAFMTNEFMKKHLRVSRPH